MTTTTEKPTVRESTAIVRDGGKARNVIITTHLGMIELRLKGTRRSEVLDVGGLWQGAVKARVMKERAEKRAARKTGGRRG